MHPDDNPNQGGDGDPSRSATDPDANDCRRRVRDNLEKIGSACIAETYDCDQCSIARDSAGGIETVAVAACEQDQDPSSPGVQPCLEVPLEVDPATMECTNFNPQADFKIATNHPDEDPVCLPEHVDPPVPVASPLTAGIFGRVTRCDVTGTAELDIGGQRTPPADGVVYFTGEPCPGGSCDVGMYFKLHVEDFDVQTSPTIFGIDLPSGFDAVKGKFREMQGWGSSVPAGAGLVSGAGRFEAGQVLSTGRGVVRSVPCEPVFNSCADSIVLRTDEDTILARNSAPLEITVARVGDPTCSLDGTVSTLGDGFGVHLAGPIVNQPPQAHAGEDHTAECTSSVGGTFTLDGSASTDPDGNDNIKLFSWRRGGRAGEQVALESTTDVDLAVGETQNYVLTVVDSFGQASHDSVVVGVADSTAPSIACNAPPAITPSNAPIGFTATAADTCDPGAGAAIVGFDCFAFTQKGKRVDKQSSCAVAMSGAGITILNSGGVDTHIQWAVRATDASGNVGAQVCEVLVVKP